MDCWLSWTGSDAQLSRTAVSLTNTPGMLVKFAKNGGVESAPRCIVTLVAFPNAIAWCNRNRGMDGKPRGR